MRKQKPENSSPDVEAVPLIAGNEDGEAIRDLREPTPLVRSRIQKSKPLLIFIFISSFP